MTVIIASSGASSWQPEPPEKGSSPSDWTKVAADLITHPGQWRAVAAQAPSSTAAKIQNGQLAAFTPHEAGRFEAVLRDMDPNTRRGTIWAAFILTDPDDGSST